MGEIRRRLLDLQMVYGFDRKQDVAKIEDLYSDVERAIGRGEEVRPAEAVRVSDGPGMVFGKGG